MSKYVVFNTIFRRVTAGFRFKRNRRLQKTSLVQKCTRLVFWSYWPDLNRRPADYESAALPAEPQ